MRRLCEGLQLAAFALADREVKVRDTTIPPKKERYVRNPLFMFAKVRPLSAPFSRPPINEHTDVPFVCTTDGNSLLQTNVTKAALPADGANFVAETGKSS